MVLRGGVLIVGSLFWDKSEKREQWRRNQLMPLKHSIRIRLPIVYGRLSSTRSNTYTIIYSKHYGQINSFGKLVKLKNQISCLQGIIEQAIELAIAEGISKKENPRICSDWGTVGLLLNPKILNQKPDLYKKINYFWTKAFFRRKISLKQNFNIFKNDEPIIFENGLLNLNWEEEYGDLDFLLTTLTVPLPKNHELTVLEIANKMTQNKYSDYFVNNKQSGIVTFQDKEIEKHLKNLSSC